MPQTRMGFGDPQVSKPCTEKMIDKPHPDLPLYEIRLKGHLDALWMTWFDGLTITLEEDGNTLLSGPVMDQPALHGLLRKVARSRNTSRLGDPNQS